jgi:hypothetical protein
MLTFLGNITLAASGQTNQYHTYLGVLYLNAHAVSCARHVIGSIFGYDVGEVRAQMQTTIARRNEQLDEIQKSTRVMSANQSSRNKK